MQNQNDVLKNIEKILSSTFSNIDSIYLHRREGIVMDQDVSINSRLIFPHYSTIFREGKSRVSEQELRFLFIEQLNQYCAGNNWDVLYSIETPTENKYRFTGEQPMLAEDGQSAMVDLSIHDKSGERICLIEFKALNPEKFCYVKDLLKLKNEPGDKCIRIFVQLLENENRGTIENIEGKISDAINANINYYCHTIKNGATRSNSGNPCKLELTKL